MYSQYLAKSKEINKIGQGFKNICNFACFLTAVVNV